jgi:CspA family cold shock protein
MQGVVRSFDPTTGEGVVVSTGPDRAEFVLARGALDESIFRMLRQGQRVNFDVDDGGRATAVRSGAEADMALPPDIQV